MAEIVPEELLDILPLSAESGQGDPPGLLARRADQRLRGQRAREGRRRFEELRARLAQQLDPASERLFMRHLLQQRHAALHSNLDHRIVELAEIAEVIEDGAAREARPLGDLIGTRLEHALLHEVEARLTDRQPRADGPSEPPVHGLRHPGHQPLISCEDSKLPSCMVYFCSMPASSPSSRHASRILMNSIEPPP